MKLFLKTLLLTLTTGLFQTTLSANATPYVYTTGGKLLSNTSKCVSQAKRMGISAGFNIDEINYDNNPGNGADIFGSDMTSKTAFSFRCETAFGVFSYATGSANNDSAYKFYKRLLDNDLGNI